MFRTSHILSSEKHGGAHLQKRGAAGDTCAVKNLILAMNGEKLIARVNPEVPVKKVA